MYVCCVWELVCMKYERNDGKTLFQKIISTNTNAERKLPMAIYLDVSASAAASWNIKKERTEGGKKHAHTKTWNEPTTNMKQFFHAFASIHVPMCRTCTTCTSLKTDSLISIFYAAKQQQPHEPGWGLHFQKQDGREREAEKRVSCVVCAARTWI